MQCLVTTILLIAATTGFWLSERNKSHDIIFGIIVSVSIICFLLR